MTTASPFYLRAPVLWRRREPVVRAAGPSFAPYDRAGNLVDAYLGAFSHLKLEFQLRTR
jgi:hypothetical protein